MKSPEILRIQNGNRVQPKIESVFILKIDAAPHLAKPAIPIENPRKKEIPDIPDPMREPIPAPTPAEPVKTPGKLVPA